MLLTLLIATMPLATTPQGPQFEAPIQLQVANAGDDNQEAFQKLWAEQEKIIKSEMTGFVWLLRQKAPTTPGRGL